MNKSAMILSAFENRLRAGLVSKYIYVSRNNPYSLKLSRRRYDDVA